MVGPVYTDYFGWVTSMKVPARRRGNVAIEEYNGAVPYKPQ